MRQRPTRAALRTSLAYGLAATIWILFSDRVLSTVVTNQSAREQIQTYKGWVFVAITGVLLYSLLRRELGRWEQEANRREQTEADLRESQERLAGVVQSAMDAIISIDAARTIVLFNSAAEQMFDRSAATAIGQSLDQFVPARSREAHAEHIRAFGQTGVTSRSMGSLETLTALRADGTEFPIEATISNAVVAGQPLYTVIIRDITTRKQAAQAFQQSANRLRVLADASTAFAQVGNDKQALFEQIARITTAALSQGCLIALLSDDQWVYPAMVYDIDPEMTELERIILSRTLHVGEQTITARVIRTQQPVLIPSVQSEQLRAATKPEYWELVDRLDISSMLYVPLQLQDRAIGSLTLYRRGREETPFDQDDLNLAQDLADRAALAIENARLFQQAQADLAERKAAEQALEAERALLARRVDERTADLSVANAELARAARLKDEFLASMSHELRTPLNSILGRSQALQELIYGTLVPKQIEVLQGVEESGRHLLALINDILDLSKIEAGKLDLMIEPTNIDLLCRMSLRIVAQSALQKRISVTSTVDSLVETIGCDERRLKQILVNLLSNAVKFTPEGGQVGLEVRGDQARQAVTFTVWDTGIGIAEADQARLFKPFSQIDSSLSRQYAGTGLGLALVLRLAQAHGGSVALESTPGQGSRFSVTLPWQLSEASPAPIPATGASSRSLPNVHQALVIEDSSSAAERITRYLTELGAHVEVHPQGNGAVAQAIALQPDLIVLDILLPDQNGWEVLRQLKAEPRTQAIPVMIVSVVDEPMRARALGAAAFLLKPIDRDIFVQSLRQVLQATEPLIEQALVIAPRAERPRILLAEDNELNIELLEYYLSAKGYEVVVARNGNEAIIRAQEMRPAVILMDIQMPGMDGLEAIRRIRADESLRDLPIIAVTALAMTGDRERCLAAGADEYLTKPVDLPKLIVTIEQQLDRPKE